MARKPQASATESAAVIAPYELKPGVLITFRPDAKRKAVSRVADTTGIKEVAFAAEFNDSAFDMAQAQKAGMIVFDNIGVAVANLDPEQEASIAAISSDDSAIATVEPEPIFFAFADGASPDFFAYLRGYRDAVNHIYDQAMGTGSPAGASPGSSRLRGLLSRTATRPRGGFTRPRSSIPVSAAKESRSQFSTPASISIIPISAGARSSISRSSQGRMSRTTTVMGPTVSGRHADRAIQPGAVATASPMMRRFLSARSSQTRVPRSVAPRLPASSGPCVKDATSSRCRLDRGFNPARRF